MRIGIDLSALSTRRTGVGSFTYYLTKHLLDLDDAGKLLGFSSGWRPIEPGALKDRFPQRHLRIPTRALYKLWEWGGRPQVDRLLGGVDIYHATNYFLPPVENARRVLSIYDLGFLKEQAWGSPKIVGPFSRNLRRFARQADAIVTCSQASKQDIVDLLYAEPEKITVTYGAVDDTFNTVSRPVAVDYLVREHGVQLPFILYVGTLEPRKNIDGLVEAFAQIAPDFPHHLVLVGQPGWNMTHLDAKIEALGVQDRIRRIGYLPQHHDLANFYSAADLFFFPSLYEGFGLPVLEAMTCACPVVCSDRGSLPEVVGNAARLVDPDDSAMMATTLRMVLMNERLREQMAQLGRRRAADFTWRRCAQDTLSVYQGLMP